MATHLFKAILAKAGLAASILLASGGVLAQSVALTAAPANAVLPDGQSVPMWGYTCGAATGATCAAMNANAGANWSPVVITVPPGSLTISLTNNLPSPPGASAGIPTSLMIVGQLGGGLGSAPTRTASPPHAALPLSWPAAGGAGDPVFTPPAQPDRVQSFGTEVAKGATTTLTWNNLKPGTYLIESGTHPSIQGPMGLYGMLVVTTAPANGTAGTAFPAVSYDTEVPVLMSEIDPVQNAAVALAVATSGFTETAVWNGQTGQCGDPAVHSCYPPAVNCDPRYYLINGVSFDRTNASRSFFAFTPTPAASPARVMLRLVNAGLRMHIPSVVGAQTVDAGGATVNGMALIAEDGNPAPGNPKIQSEVFMAAGKTYDVLINAPAATSALPIFDRQLSLSTNNTRDGGMQAFLGASGALLPASTAASANGETYYCTPGVMLAVTDPSKGVLANDVGANGAALQAFTGANATDTLNFNGNGTFTYTPDPAATTCGGSFTYLVNGTLAATATIAQCGAGCLGGAPTANADAYTSNVASRLQISPAGVLANDTDPSGLPMTAVLVPGSAVGGTVTLNADGSFVVAPSAAPVAPNTASVTFQYNAVNSQKTSSAPATVTVTFNGGSGLAVSVKDAPTGLAISDYRWIIEEDRTFHVDPAKQTNTGGTPVPALGVNFHTSNMPVIAEGCVGAISCGTGQTVLDPATGNHVPAVCDVGNGTCRTDASQLTSVDPSQVALDPAKRYYISILPGDGANPTIGGAGGAVEDPPGSGKMRQFNIGKDCGTFNGAGPWAPGGPDALCGHAMGGAQIAAGQTAASVMLQQTPLPTAKVSVFVFEDDYPLNGENDAGGGVDILAPNEPGLGSFNLVLLDAAGNFGDTTGQITYDEFNQPVTNSLAGMKDPVTGNDACPISPKSTDGMVGVVVTCPTYESDGKTLSPLAGQAVIANLYPGLYEVVATPAADRIAKGEEWLQTSTLDGTKPIEAFLRPGEPNYFQEFGPGGYHVMLGFANPKIITGRKNNKSGTGLCDPASGGGGGLNCNATIKGHVTNMHMSRTPDQRVYSSGDYTADSYTQCYVALGSPDVSPTFDFTKCDPDGNFTFTNVPQGNYQVTVFDQWNDLLVDGLSTPIVVGNGPNGSANNLSNSTNTKCTGNPPVCTYEIAVTQWRTNLYTRTFLDQNGDGVSQDGEPGLPLVSTNIRYRDGSICCFNSTDLEGNASFNEVFPYLNWLVAETDSTRYKPTGIHVINDVGGPVDTTGPGQGLLTSTESPTAHLPADLRIPGARYCATADCAGSGSFDPASGNPGSSGRVDPPWVSSEGWQGLLGQSGIMEFGMKPFATGENGGIKGHVIYASTRPFDDPSLLLQLQWEPGVPNVTVNLYQENTAADGSTSLKLVDTTQTSSFDDWAQGFRRDANGNLMTDASGRYIPNMSCPGVETSSVFYFTLQNSTQWLDPTTPLAEDSRFKCFDGWAAMNQIEPAPYDGMYKFPSVTARDPATGKPTKTNCTICSPNPAADYDQGAPMLPVGKYVVEVIVPEGYELVKEEDKNILIGDIYIAPVTQQFAGFGNIFILPDQAQVNATYNPNNTQNPTTNLGSVTFPRHEGDTGSIESFWPCVGAKRVVPDYLSLFPGAQQSAPFAGATRSLCDRKEVTLADQASALAKFYIYSSTHVAGHFTGAITNDYASEFDPFSPQFGEKFGVPNLPVALKDHTGHEMGRVYSDEWGFYNGMNYSTWTVNPPNPTGYAPTMMITCMNDPGPIPDPAHPGQMIIDPLYNPAYANFCYEIPFMPGQTSYLDTPVIPTMAFADNYNLPDCAYPDATPAVKSVTTSDFQGPWVSNSGNGHTLTITALGDQSVPNHAYSGPSSTTAPYNAKTITRHYGFGGTAGSVALVGSDGVARPLTGVSWSDTTITGTVPNNVPQCVVQQRNVPGTERCGELVITTAAGKRSTDAITVTIGGKTPTLVTPASPASTTFGEILPNPIQTAIDNATPGDLIIVAPGTYRELVIMWKPVRLQGVGAASVIINADAHPAGNIDPWRRRVDCLFGLSLNGRPLLNDGTFPADTYDPTGGYTCPASMQQRVDRIPFEAIVGWDTAGNGNLAQLLQEPTLMGAYEGAGITVLGRGMRIPNNSRDFWGAANAGGYPTGAVYLTNSNADCTASTTRTDGRDYGTSNFLCNPSRIDGISVINSSQGGGGIFLHAWNHNIEISNNRITANQGTVTGGITVGPAEFPDPVIVGTDVGAGVNPPLYNIAQVYSGIPGNQRPSATGEQAGYGYVRNVNMHNNNVSGNASIGDALYSYTPSAAGGVSFTSGSDFYKFTNNWVCGNLSPGDGAGVSHIGMSDFGTIANNTIIFNQSTNPTLPTHGGGLGILGASPDRTLPNGQECGNTASDADCPPGLPEGTGRSLLIDANVIMGNSAESGSGGGLRLQMVNGQDVQNFPTQSSRWYAVTVQNNIIANNVAGWDGGGVSLQDALKVNFINNTVVHNDTTASAGVLFNTLAAPLSSTPPPGCTPQPDPSLPQNPNCIDPVPTSTPQAAGLVTMQNTPNLTAALTGSSVSCPNGYGYTNTSTTDPNSCRNVSRPAMSNDLFWRNRSFYISVGGFGSGTQNQQHLVSLVPLLNQTFTGMCAATGVDAGGGAAAPEYWDIGVRGDTGPTNHGSGVTLAAATSIFSTGSDPQLLREYCNGSRLPPENGGHGYSAPPGQSEFAGLPPVFALNNITPAATTDEGNNWINLGYGPLSLVSPADGTTVLGNYGIQGASPAVNTGTNAGAPDHDIFGTHRPQGTRVDIGAVEYVVPAIAVASVSGGPLAFGDVGTGTTSTAQTLTLSNNGGASLTGISVAVTAPFSRSGGNCGTTLAAGATCTINVVFAPTATGPASGTATVSGSVAVSGTPVALSGNGIALVATASITPATWSPSQTRNCPGTNFLGRLACSLDPAQAFTVTNTGTATLTGITNGVLGGTNASEYRMVNVLSTCGPAGGGQLVGNTTLAPGANCVVTVQFQPQTSQSTGVKNATVSVTDSAGTQTATLSGRAN